MQEKLGVDVGGVITDALNNDETDTAFSTDNYLNTTAVRGAFDALRLLVDLRFGRNVFIVSRCGPVFQQKTCEWFAHHRFYERTGIMEANVRFCRELSEKAPICQELGITHFIDDRLAVVLQLMDVVDRSYLFNSSDDNADYVRSRFPTKIIPVANWDEVLQELIPGQ